MPEEKLKFVGCYMTQELYKKFHYRCYKRETSHSKELLALIMAACKTIKLEDDNVKSIVSENPST